MIAAQDFLTPLSKNGFNFFTGTPCSYLKPFINYVIDSPELVYVDSVNEGDAVAIASGATLGGKRSVVMFQNSGLGNAVSPLTSLNAIFDIPILGITTLRGEPGGPSDEPQHKLMGQITTDLLDLMKIPWSFFPRSLDEVEPSIQKALASLDATSRPFFFVMRKDDIAPYDLQSKQTPAPPPGAAPQTLSSPQVKSTRTQALSCIQSAMKRLSAVAIATTGMTSRELYFLKEQDNQFYMVGSMGCALPVGIGLALARPDLSVFVIDGDGALLMRTGSMATAGFYRPPNLFHILLDNHCHDSTGGQATVSGGVKFDALAHAFGYIKSQSLPDLESFACELEKVSPQSGPQFFHLEIAKGSPEGIGRPKHTPQEMKTKFIIALKENLS